ncbi:MAG: hypothetical protein ACI9XP_001560 [Lentimonas sp.]
MNSRLLGGITQKMNKEIYILLILVVNFFSGCKNETSQKDTVNKSEKLTVDTTEITSTPKILNSRLDSILEHPVDWERLKKLGNQSTSSPTNQKKHYKPNENGIYGGYTLFKNSHYLGNLTVYYYGEKPWLYDNNQEYFIAYYANAYKFKQDTSITVLNGVHLGMADSELKAKLGEPLKIWRDYYIYHNQKNIIAFFKLNKSTIDEIEIGKFDIDLAKDSLTIDFLQQLKTTP